VLLLWRERRGLMSKEAAAGFYQKLGEDEDLLDRVSRLAPDDMTGLLKIAASAGFGSFTREEYWSAASAAGRGEAQLSDVELEGVAGGMRPRNSAGRGCKTGTPCWGY
jgi:predicted ribosomally synthesized peptide with nif11-like leader